MRRAARQATRPQRAAERINDAVLRPNIEISMHGQTDDFGGKPVADRNAAVAHWIVLDASLNCR